jgi:5'-nucleotidase
MEVLNYQGKLINPLNLQMSDLDNIGMQSAITLSRINRFWGQTRETYSVSQHCLALVQEAEKEGRDKNTLILLLIHESFEALTGMDLPSPLKHSEAMVAYVVAENNCLDMMLEKYSLDASFDTIKTLDKRVMVTEAEALMPYNSEVNWRDYGEPYGKLYKLGASEKEIREDFINKWYELLGTLA